MELGYARVSTQDQDLQAQINSLKASGCEKIFQEKEKGGRWDRPELHKLLNSMKPGDMLVVWKLDRLSRSLKDLLMIMDQIHKAGCGFKSLTEAIDTTTPAGRMMMQIVGAFAEFEKAILKERTLNGLYNARLKGRIGGRRPKLKRTQEQEIVRLIKSGSQTAADAARLFDVHPSTICRLLKRSGVSC